MSAADVAARCEELLNGFAPITLDDMGAVRLMNRVDQKYLTSTARLAQFLDALAEDYFVQRIDGRAWADYRTLYFDTSELDMYTQHHNQRLARCKLRARAYRHSQSAFFELKQKSNKGKTRKKRIAINPDRLNEALFLPEVAVFLRNNTAYAPIGLYEQVENSFRRLTLVNKAMTERLTIDCDIRFFNHATGRTGSLGSLVVIEAKHELDAPESTALRTLRTLRIQPNGMSKYCIGTVLTNPAAKYNQFKPKILIINKLTERT